MRVYRAKIYQAPFVVHLDRKTQQFLAFAVRQPRVSRSALIERHNHNDREHHFVFLS
jgi:hypothetical protein